MCISLMEEKSYALIHRVLVMVKVEKEMEEAIAKACISSRAPLSSSLHLRVKNDAHSALNLPFCSKRVAPFTHGRTTQIVSSLILTKDFSSLITLG